MQSFLAKLAALAFVAGGFLLTGDLGRLVDRGRRVIEGRSAPAAGPSGASDVAAARADDMADAVAGAAAPKKPADTAPLAPPAAPAGPVAPTEPPAAAPPRGPASDAPVGRRVAVPPPPATGPTSVEPRELAAGDRVLVWVRKAGRSAGAAYDMVALDIVDPGSAEALLHRHAALVLDGRTRVEAAPRRVVIGAAGAPGIARNAPLSVTPLHGVNGAGRPETLGPVAAIEIVRTAPAAN
jgi:hypothetical protein